MIPLRRIRDRARQIPRAVRHSTVRWLSRPLRLPQRIGLWAALSLGFLLLVRTGLAQRDGQQPGVDSVFLETDSVAAKKLAAARDLFAAKQWGDGIDLIRQIADQHPERLVGISPGRYVSVQTYCDILLSSLPPEGLALYRTKTDPQARRWFESAKSTRDVSGLQRVLSRAYVSSYGDDALQLLGELAWEEGRLAQSRSYWEQLLPAHREPEPGQLPLVLRYPGTGTDVARLEAQLILCSLLEGEIARGERELDRFRSDHGNAQGQLAGRSGRLVEILERIADEVRQSPQTPEIVRSPTFAGNPARSVVHPTVIDVGSIQWSVPLGKPAPAVDARDKTGHRGERADRARPPGALSCYPVLSGNHVFYADESAIYARELISGAGGQAAWGTDPAIYRTQEQRVRGVGEAVRQKAGVPRFTLSIDRERLFTRLGGAGTRATQPALRGPENVLVCLDLARQGDLAWVLRPDRMEEGITDWTFDGAPLAVDGRVYVALRRSEPQLQLNVACLEGESGKVLWNRRVCLGLDAFGPEVEELRHQLLSLAGERLYYNTNLGAVAALDARDGALHWVASYPRAEVDSRTNFTRRQMHGPNPCVVHDGRVFAAPYDSDQVLCFDAESGVMEWQRELKGNAHQLVGVEGERLIVAGDSLWGMNVESGRVAWSVAQAGPDGMTHGRAALAVGHVYWPRRDEILVVETATGLVRREVDLRDQHGIPGGGNIVLTEGGLVLAQADRLAVFSEFGSLRKDKEQQLSQRPDDPAAHLELARVAEAQQDWPTALAAYETARHLGEAHPHVAGAVTEVAVARRAQIRQWQDRPEEAVSEWKSRFEPLAKEEPFLKDFAARQRARRAIDRLTSQAANIPSSSTDSSSTEPQVPISVRLSESRSGARSIPEGRPAQQIVRVWERRVAKREKVVLVEGPERNALASRVLLSGPEVTCYDLATGNERWNISAGEPVVWAGGARGKIGLGTATTLTCVNGDDGRICWHRQFPVPPVGAGSSRGLRATSFRVTGEDFFCHAPEVGLLCLAIDDGSIRWGDERVRSIAQSAWYGGPDWIFSASSTSDQWCVWSSAWGWRSEPFTVSGVARSVVPIPIENGLAFSDGVHLPTIAQFQPGGPAIGVTVHTGYRGPLSSGAAEVELVAGPTSLLALIEGMTLARVDPATGEPLWSSRLGPASLGGVRPRACADDLRVYTLSAGILRAMALGDGTFLWERYLGPARDEWRIERSGACLVLSPMGGASRKITLCDPASGAFVARLDCGSESGNLRFVSAADRALVATRERLTGYQFLAAVDR